MKIKQLLITIVCCVLILTVAACGGAAEKPYEKGTLDESSFTSEYLDLRFTIPEGYIMAKVEEMDQMMNLGADIMGLDEKLVDYAKLTTVYEMMAVAADGSANVIVMAEKIALSNMTEDQYLEALKTQLANVTEMNYEFNNDIVSTEIVGKSYKKLTVTTSAYGQDMIQNYIFRKIDDRMVGFITTSSPDSEEALNVLMAGFSQY